MPTTRSTRIPPCPPLLSLASARRLVLTALLALLGAGLIASRAAAQDAGAAALASRYASMRAQLDASPLGVPVLVTSMEDGNLVRGEVHAVLAQPFDKLLSRLGVPRDWCQVVLLHLNIKTCTYEHSAEQDWVTFYSGRKFYESPDKAYPLRFAFRATPQRGEFLDLDLSAAGGPMNTSDYRITLAAIPVPQGSFVRFSYAYRSSMLSRLAMGTYLATLGSGKVGFSVAGTGSDGKPIYVEGARGIVERNAVRYYFAIQAYLEGAALPPALRLEHDLARWFDLTERFALQLHEMDKTEYLQGKRQEAAEQARRQQAIDADSAGRRTAPAQ